MPIGALPSCSVLKIINIDKIKEQINDDMFLTCGAESREVWSLAAHLRRLDRFPRGLVMSSDRQVMF